MKHIIQKLCMVMAMLFSFLTISASTFVNDGLEYQIISSDDRTVSVIGTVINNIEDLEIPERVMDGSLTYNVIAIDREAFYNHECLRSIKIPNSVTSIGDYAFSYCYSLATIDISKSVTSIGEGAFCGCSSLTTINIPNSVTSIGEGAFLGCSSLSMINVDNNPKYISVEGILYTKNNNSPECLISCPGGKSGAIIIPNSVTSIGVGAFLGCKSLTSINIPNSVTSIGDHAFWGCKSLTSIDIPNSVTSIGDYAFGECKSLTSIDIPNSVTSIGDHAFWGCESLTSIDIPNSVTSIGDGAFSDCSSIENVYCYWDSPIEAGNELFEIEVLKNAILHVPLGTKDKYEKVDPWQNFWNIEETDYSGIDAISDDSRKQQD